MSAQRGAVLLMTFQRSHELGQVIESLRAAWNSSYQELLVIEHEGFPQVTTKIQSIDWIIPRIVQVKHEEKISAASNINKNLYLGLSTLFETSDVEFVTVVEDDIYVSSDFLKFSAEVVDMEISNTKFMGVNGFSGAKYSKYEIETYGRFRFGFGWGWTIPRRTWNLICDTLKNNSEMHWDGLVEPIIKSGYVVMPHNSKLVNLGFGITATHTIENSLHEGLLNASFSGDSVDIFSYKPKFSHFELNWRFDAVPFQQPIGFRGRLINLLYSIMPALVIRAKDANLRTFLKQHSLGLIQKLAIVLTKD